MGTDSPAPVTLPRAEDAARGAVDWLVWATVGFVALGVALRVSRYLLNFPLWCDETMIAANFLDRGYRDLFRPLDYRQVAPLLWLVAELTSARVLGFSEYGLRFVPFLCGVASVPLFWHVARRLMSGLPLLLAVAIFAVSGWPLRYVAEVKPYASDLFVALAVLALAVEWRRRPDRVGWLWALALAGPFAVGFSLPSLFVLGGVGLALAWPVWRSGRWSARWALAAFGAGVVVTFVTLQPFYKTAPQDHDYFHNAWSKAFPPLTNPWRLIVWLVDANTGFMFAYPEGGARGASTLTSVAVAVGVVVLWRNGRRLPALLLTLPFGLALVAASIHRYPYGFSARTTQYAAPMICLLAGLGAAGLLAAIPSRSLRCQALRGLVAGLAVLGVARLGMDMARPYKTVTDARVRSFAQWFWTEFSRNSELVCGHGDLGVDFDPAHWTTGATDTYLVYQRIASPRHIRRLPANLDRVSDTHLLRVVFFNEIPHAFHAQAFNTWLARMSDRFQLRNVSAYPVSTLEKKRGATWDQIYMVYEFVPRTPTVARGGSDVESAR